MDGKDATENPQSQIREEGAHHGGDVVIEEDPSWIWMTNIWHESSDCGPAWELMYTHKFPGQITHTSLSRRKNEDEDQGAEKESIRLAIVYKVVRDEHVAYHSRVYHFGIYETRTELEECNVGFLETCHVHAPFVSFDYILPGSTPFKDVSLEHDMILYSRLIDTAAFRSLKLPVLQPGATSPEHPYALGSGVPGPSLSCRERKNMPYRMSYLSKIPSDSDESDDFHVMMGQVQEYAHRWEYSVSIATEVAEAITRNKMWLTEQQWPVRQFPSLTQENDMINDEPHTYGVSIQKPYIGWAISHWRSVKSADGSSIHIPLKDVVMTLDTKRFLNLESDHLHVNGQDKQQRQLPQKRKFGAEYYLIPSSNFREQWIESSIDIGSLDTIDTIQGVINNAADVMALKTARNSILVLKRHINKSSTDGDDLDTQKGRRWHLSMVLSDSLYDPALGNMERREVLAMKIVGVEVPVLENVDGEVLSESRTEEGEVQSWTEEGHGARTKKQENDPSGPGQTLTRVHNILFLTYGDGRLDAYDLNRATELSSFVKFLKAKYPVVIGMLAVVITFVINEAR
ncbi:hypothetical protein BGX34_007440 [Mortierella sp. NVP85]|nr:hypothetical protein BGX34_007440 [Mortierella sp. NVP85]